MAFFEAGKRVVDESDWLVAVWDGQPARGLGEPLHPSYAERRGKSVEVVWPTGLTR